MTQADMTGEAPVIIAIAVPAADARETLRWLPIQLAIDSGQPIYRTDLVLDQGWQCCRTATEMRSARNPPNVATRPESCPHRKTVKMIDGERMKGWFTETIHRGRS